MVKNYKPSSSGGLRKASRDVIHLCQLGETIFREFEPELCKMRNVMAFLSLKTLIRLDKPLFLTLRNHFIETGIDENRVYNLQKMILHKYFTIRLHHLAFLINENNIKFRLRHVNNKRTLFEHQ